MDMKWVRSAARLSGVTLVLVGLAACGEIRAGPFGEGDPPSRGQLEQLAESTDMPIYYLGDEYDGHPLDVTVFNNVGTEVNGDWTLDPGQSHSMSYGETCDFDTCSSLHEVQTYPSSS